MGTIEMEVSEIFNDSCSEDHSNGKTENGDIDIFAKCVNTFSRNNHFKVKLRIQLILILFVSVVD